MNWVGYVQVWQQKIKTIKTYKNDCIDEYIKYDREGLDRSKLDVSNNILSFIKSNLFRYDCAPINLSVF